MKVAITGHTRGIGAELAKRFSEKDDTEVIGFSRSNGFDLTNQTLLEKSLDLIEECDVFVNNAFYEEVQYQMLQSIFLRWRGERRKYIINIGSSSTYYLPISDFANRPDLYRYAQHKRKLDQLILKYQIKEGGPVIFNIRPGYVDTDMVKRQIISKMNVETAVDVMMYAFDNRDTFLIRDIVYEPV